MLVLPSQAPVQGVVRFQDSTERSWFKVSRLFNTLMKYSCDRQRERVRDFGSDAPENPRRLLDLHF